MFYIDWGLCCQKGLSRPWLSNHIPHKCFGCNYLSTPMIHASGAEVLNFAWYFVGAINFMVGIEGHVDVKCLQGSKLHSKYVDGIRSTDVSLKILIGHLTVKESGTRFNEMQWGMLCDWWPWKWGQGQQHFIRLLTLKGKSRSAAGVTGFLLVQGWLNKWLPEPGGWDADGLGYFLNSLWPGDDAIWWYTTGWTLAQVMACCLTAPSHYLNQCWLTIRVVLWHSSEGNFSGNAQDICPGYEFENLWFKITVTKGQWVNKSHDSFLSITGPLCGQGHWLDY